jgi:hypothetical protein
MVIMTTVLFAAMIEVLVCLNLSPKEHLNQSLTDIYRPKTLPKFGFE